MAKKLSKGQMRNFGIGDKIKSFDIFASGINFNVDGKEKANQSYLGTAMTVILMVLTCTYAFRRYNVMVEYGDTVHQTTIQPHLTTKDDILEDTTFKIGLALSSYNFRTDQVELDDFSEYLEFKTYINTVYFANG